ILSKMIMALDFRFVRRTNPSGRPFLAIENLRPQAGEKALYEARLNAASGNPEEVYAIISYLPGPVADSRFLVLAGESTAGTQCACEYLVDGGSSHIHGQLPPVYQILLKATIHDFVPTHT